MEKAFSRKMTILQKINVAIGGALLSFKSEISIRIQSCFAIASIVLGLYLHVSHTDWLAIIFGIALVLITEMMNTAVEKLVDLVSPGYNELAGKVKDIAAGAVFIAALVSLVVALIVFIPYF